jgi:hypothetical protein
MEKRLEFHFKGGSAENRQLPIEFMINLLNNVRELTYLIVSQEKGISFNGRFKPPKQIKDNCVIKCELAKEGSYSQALSFEYTEQNIKPFEKIEETLQFVIDSDESKIIHSFPNAKMRSRVLSCVKQAFPQSDSDIYVEIANGNSKLNSKVIQKNITAIIDKTQAVVEEHMTAVTGYLTSIDFAKRKMIIFYPVTSRSLDCFYNEEIEDMLLENRRQLVQVIGMAVLDENDHPREITDVVSIQEIDLSPIELDCICCECKSLRFKNRLVLTPVLDDSKQLYAMSYPEFGLETFAYTRQEIIDGIKSDIAMLWSEYAETADEALTEGAIELKQKLLSNIEEISNAS